MTSTKEIRSMEVRSMGFTLFMDILCCLGLFTCMFILFFAEGKDVWKGEPYRMKKSLFLTIVSWINVFLTFFIVGFAWRFLNTYWEVISLISIYFFVTLFQAIWYTRNLSRKDPLTFPVNGVLLMGFQFTIFVCLVFYLHNEYFYYHRFYNIVHKTKSKPHRRSRTSTQRKKALEE